MMECAKTNISQAWHNLLVRLGLKKEPEINDEPVHICEELKSEVYKAYANETEDYQ